MGNMGISKSAFTLRDDNLLRALMTPCWISKAYNPQEIDKPQIRQYDALWDTGATGTVISKRVAQELGIKPVGMRQVFTASSGNTGILTNEYLINVHLPNNVGIAFVRATEGTLNGFDVLVGMDIISKGDLAITHKDGKTAFSFQMPSTHDIDFVEEDNEEKRLQFHTPIKKEKTPGRNDLCPCGSGRKYKNCHGK